MGSPKKQRRLDYLKACENRALNTTACETIADNNFVNLIKNGMIVVEPIPFVEIRK